MTLWCHKPACKGSLEKIASLLLQQELCQYSNKQRIHMVLSLGKAGCDLFGPAEVKHPTALKLQGSDLHTSHHRLCTYSIDTPTS